MVRAEGPGVVMRQARLRTRPWRYSRVLELPRAEQAPPLAAPVIWAVRAGGYRLLDAALRPAPTPDHPLPRSGCPCVRQSHVPSVPRHAVDALGVAGDSAGQISRSGGAPGTPSAWETPQQGWTLVQVANELGVDRNTVRDRLNTYRLRRLKHRTLTGRVPVGAVDRSSADTGTGAHRAHGGEQPLHHAVGRHPAARSEDNRRPSRPAVDAGRVSVSRLRTCWATGASRRVTVIGGDEGHPYG
jgi:hypothetical protein